jgi:arylsulfatase A-like enzyme
MTDECIGWMMQQKAPLPDKLFFVYFAPGATHAPHQVPKEWSGKYKGKFSAGGDSLREQTFARQKELGIIPQDAQLTARHDGIPAWDDVSADMKPVLERQMEVYAGFLERVDHHVGRLIETLEKMELLDDTLIYYIVGDNGASAEGRINGSLNENFILNNLAEIETAEYLRKNINKFGGTDSYGHYSFAWAHALDTPYQWTKQIASHWGGTRNACVVHWPNGIKAKGEIQPVAPFGITDDWNVILRAIMPLSSQPARAVRGSMAWPTRSPRFSCLRSIPAASSGAPARSCSSPQPPTRG